MGLTRRGICAQILSSIETYRSTDFCTVNDCKVVINHLIRKFSEPLSRSGDQICYSSHAANGAIDVETVREHLVPVSEIMDILLAWESLEVTDARIEEVDKLLAKMLVIVTISKDEDAALNSSGYQRKMPPGYYDPEDRLFEDVWARYKAAGIFGNIIK